MTLPPPWRATGKRPDSASDAQTIIGFTEAELGLVLATVFLALWLGATAKPKLKPIPTPQVPVISADSGNALIAKLDSLTRIVNSLRLLRSETPPSCIETKVIVSPVAKITVLSDDKFRKDGLDLSLSWVALKENLQPFIDEAQKAGCKHIVQVSALPSVPGPLLISAVRKLQLEFYTRLRER